MRSLGFGSVRLPSARLDFESRRPRRSYRPFWVSRDNNNPVEIYLATREERRVLLKKSPFTRGGDDGGGVAEKKKKKIQKNAGLRAQSWPNITALLSSSPPSSSPSFMRRSLKWLRLSSYPSKSANRCTLVWNASKEHVDVGIYFYLFLASIYFLQINIEMVCF